MKDLKVKKAAVIGSPIQHSLSPKIFEFLSRSQGVSNFEYRSIEILPAQLDQEIKKLGPENSYVGFNVTFPHKEKVLHLVDQKSFEAQAVGAVNVVAHTSNGTKGYNTDIYGIQKTLKEHKVAPKENSALVLGAGGAARAVVYALAEMGCPEVQIHSRNPVNAQRIINDMKSQFSETRYELLRDGQDQTKAALIVNATPVGMTGYTGQELDFEPFLNKNRNGIAFDLIYRPEHTTFLKLAIKQGYQAIGGLDMLVYQALKTWEIWFQELKNPSETKRALVAHLRKILRPS